jgi:hypothetical protein
MNARQLLSALLVLAGMFSAVPLVAQPYNITPTVCIKPSEDFTFFDAYFGYESFEPNSIVVPVDTPPGTANNFNVVALNGALPTHFFPGLHVPAFRTLFVPTQAVPRLVWTFNGVTASADWTTKQCPVGGRFLNVDNSDVSPANPTRYSPETDGVLILRYLFGFRGAALIQNARGTGSQLRDANAIAEYLNANRRVFDVDGDGKTLALSDGVMILRRLLGLSGAALTANAKRGVMSDLDVQYAIDSLQRGEGPSVPVP